jgi:hypothetical protein
MQNEKEELDQMIDIFYDKVDVMAIFDKIQFHFDEVINDSVSEVVKRFPLEGELVVIAEHYSNLVFNLMETCKDFVNLYDDGEKISARRILNLLDTIQVDIVGLNESPRQIPELELYKPELEPEVRAVVLEVALQVIDADVHNLTATSKEKLNDFLILESERRKMLEEGSGE